MAMPLWVKKHKKALLFGAGLLMCGLAVGVTALSFGFAGIPIAAGFAAVGGALTGGLASGSVAIGLGIGATAIVGAPALTVAAPILTAAILAVSGTVAGFIPAIGVGFAKMFGLNLFSRGQSKVQYMPTEKKPTAKNFQRKSTPNIKESTLKREESTLKREESTPKREESPPNIKESTPKREESPPNIEESTQKINILMKNGVPTSSPTSSFSKSFSHSRSYSHSPPYSWQAPSPGLMSPNSLSLHNEKLLLRPSITWSADSHLEDKDDEPNSRNSSFTMRH